MIFDNYSAEEADVLIAKMQASHGNFTPFKGIKDADELISIAKARAKAKKKTSYKNLFFTEEDLRFATPEVVAEYRAERLQCKTLVDIGCSIGLQTFAFARHCNKVIAIEIDERKIAYAKQNAKKLDIKNIEFIHGDALEPKIIQQIHEAEIVFSDTERLPEEKSRSLDRVNPNIGEVLRKYGHLTEDFCFEIPASIGFVDISGEKEYLDIDKKLNR